MADVPQELPLHRAVRDDARRNALAEALAQEEAAVGESLERVGVRIAAVAERWMADIAQRAVEIVDAVRQRARGDRRVDDRRIGDVVRRVLRKARMKQDLRTLR